MNNWGAIIPGGHWMPVPENDPVAAGLYDRHYSAHRYGGEKGKSRNHNITLLDGSTYKLASINVRVVRRANKGFLGPGEKLVMLTNDGRALWAWTNPDFDMRLDKQPGLRCAVFRNESDTLSSNLVQEADEIAWQRWPDIDRHYTYVWDDKVRSVNPGYCYKKAGWRTCGRNKDGRLTILEIFRPKSSRCRP